MPPEDAGSIPATSTQGCSRFYAVDAHESHNKKRPSPQNAGLGRFLLAADAEALREKPVGRVRTRSTRPVAVVGACLDLLEVSGSV
ncbi:MAG: hypothetical protein NVS3B26_25500 [Mycobacteriales bacterium]